MTVRPLTLACLVLALAACKPSTPVDAAPADAAAAATAPTSRDTDTTPATPALSASAEEDVKASMDRFLKAKSFHAVMQMEGARALTHDLDFVAPDRYRMQMPVGTQVIIGDTIYIQADGRTMEVPLPKGSLSQWRDPLKLEENQASLTVDALGADAVEGMPARKYRVDSTRPDTDAFELWIGANGLPLQLRQQGQAQGKPYTMTLRYSRFDDPTISIDAPR